MLFYLTGDIQTGKTRWLQNTVSILRDQGVCVAGVIAPGVWKELANEPGEPIRYEKLGINNILLPSGNVVPFARRADLARQEGRYDEGSQAARAGLHWHLYDSAIAEVNAHFSNLAANASRIGADGKSLLVVDELGQLELNRGEGLSSAVELLSHGASAIFPHALIVVRAQLLPTAQQRFPQHLWNGSQAIAPDEEGLQAVLDALQLPAD